MFDNLPTNILEHILTYIPWFERIRLERVCQRWSEVMPYVDVTKISIEDVLDRYDVVHLVTAEQYYDLLSAILLRAGGHLKAIDLRTPMRGNIRKGVLSIICERCAALKSLTFDSSKFEVASLPVIPSLQSLEMHIDCLVDERGDVIPDDNLDSNGAGMYPMLVASELFSSLLASMTELKSLTLILTAGIRLWLRCENLTECVLYSKQLETNQLRVMFQHCRRLSKLHLLNARIRNVYDLPEMDSMRELHLYSLPVTDGDLALLFASCRFVTNLLIKNCDRRLRFEALSLLEFLVHLEIAQKDNFCFTDILNSLNKKIVLESLLYSGLNVSDQNMATISTRCPMLTSLYITADSLSGRNNFSSDSVRTLLTCCRRLSKLSLFGSSIDNSIFFAILDFGSALTFVDLTRSMCSENGLLHFALLRAKRIAAGKTPDPFRGLQQVTGAASINHSCENNSLDNKDLWPQLEIAFGVRRVTIVETEVEKREEFFSGLKDLSRIIIS